MGLPAVPNKGRHIRRFPLASGETPAEGAIAILDANGEVAVGTVTAAAILGFFAHAVPLSELDPDPGFCLVYVAMPDSTFWIEGDDAPVQADIGDQADLIIAADGSAELDLATVVAARLNVEDVDLTRNLYEVSVLAANREMQP